MLDDATLIAIASRVLERVSPRMQQDAVRLLRTVTGTPLLSLDELCRSMDWSTVHSDSLCFGFVSLSLCVRMCVSRPVW